MNFPTGLSSESSMFSHDLLVRDNTVSTVVGSERKFFVAFSNYALFLVAGLPAIDILVPAISLSRISESLVVILGRERAARSQTVECAGTAAQKYLVPLPGCTGVPSVLATI